MNLVKHIWGGKRSSLVFYNGADTTYSQPTYKELEFTASWSQTE